MEELMTYLLKSALYSALFLSIYWCFLKNETFYRFNRHFLLTGVLCAIILPFYTYTYRVNIVASASLGMHNEPFQLSGSNGVSWFYVLMIVYVVGACFLLSRHIAGLSRIKRMISKYGYTKLQGYKLVRTPVFKSSFSVFNYIIIDNSSQSSEVERKLILAHELAHVKQFHWLDLLISQLFCALQWFNPLAWLYLSAIKQNHEFLADQAVLKQGNSAAVYRAALINHSLGTSVFSFASSFSQHNQLKRISMMMKPASVSFKKVAVLLVFPVLALAIWAFKKPEFKVLQVDAKVVEGGANDKLVKSQVVADVSPKQVVLPKKKKSVVSGSSSSSIKPKTKVSFDSDKPVVLQDDAIANVTYKPSVKRGDFFTEERKPLVYLDGVEVSSMEDIDTKNIESINVIKNQSAVAKYGEKARNGVILINSKIGQWVPK